MAVVAHGEISLRPDLKGFQSSLTNALKSAVGSAGAALGAAFIGTGAIQFLSSAIQGAIDLGEVTNKLKVVFGDAAGEVAKIGDTSATSLGLSRRAALDAVGGIGLLLTSLGIAPQAAAAMSTSLVQLAADIASLQNVAGGAAEVMVAIRAGLVGETEPLRRLGISFDDAALKTKAAELGLVKFRKSAGGTGSTARAVADAVERLGDVQRQAADRAEQAQEQIESANRRVTAAEQRVADAARASVAAQERLTDARADAKRVIDDLTFAVADNAIRQRQANLNLKKATDAERVLRRTRGASASEREQAALDIAQAQRDVAETTRDNQQEEKELAAARAAGVDGSEGVRTALESVAAAQRDAIAADREHADALVGVTKAHVDASRAQEDAARDVARAQRSVADAANATAAGFTSTTEALDPAIRAQAAYALILEKGKINAGDFANTSDALANRQRILSANVEDLKDRIGTALLPAFERIVAYLETKAIPFLENTAIPAFEKWAPVLADIAEHIDDVLAVLAAPLLTALKLADAIGDATEKLRDFIKVAGRASPGVKAVLKGLIPGLSAIPGFAEGGIVPGPLGAPVLAMVHGGETITPPGQGGNVFHVSVSFSGAVSEQQAYMAGQAVGRGAAAEMDRANARRSARVA